MMSQQIFTLHANVSSAANNLKKSSSYTSLFWGRAFYKPPVFRSCPITGLKFHALGASSPDPSSLLNLWRRGSLIISVAHTSAPSSRTPVSTTATYLSSIWTSRMVLSMWDLLPGSLLQGTQR